MDAGYGNNSELRAEITALELTYVAGILSNTTVWPRGTGPRPPKKWSGRGRPPKRLRLDTKHQPISVKELALSLPKRAWHRVEWREGTAERLSSRFARVRIRVARNDGKRSEPRPEEWLLIEWPNGESAPTKYWLSTLPESSAGNSALETVPFHVTRSWHVACCMRLPGFKDPTTEIPTPPSDYTPLRRRCAFQLVANATAPDCPHWPKRNGPSAGVHAGALGGFCTGRWTLQHNAATLARSLFTTRSTFWINPFEIVTPYP